MSANNTVLVRRHHEEIWSKGNVDAVDEMYAPEFVGHHPGAPDWIGPQSVKRIVRLVRDAFPDFRETVEDVFAAGDRVVTRFIASGTHRGAYRGIAPTGRSVAMPEMAIFRVAGGKIVEKWGALDRLDMFQQLGVMPPVSPPFAFLYDITMDVEVQDIGATPAGHRRIVCVKGGTFTGPALRGRVVPGGGDWLVGRADGSRRLDVRLTLETDDGSLIYASYGGLFYGASDVLGRIAAGATADVSEYYFRTAPMFETAAERYAWLNRTLAIAYGRRTSSEVGYSVYAIL